jgi:glycosyltransferase involved in cell wall biosynthesis
MALLKKFKKYKIVYSLQDIFPDSLVNAKMTKKGSLIWKIGRWVENITYNAADKIIVISEDFKKNIMEKGVPEEKIEVIYNWVDENTVVYVPREQNPLFDTYNLDRNKFYICYSGNIGLSQNMEMLTEVAKEIEDNQDIGFVIVGDGAFKPKLQEIIKEKELKNITLIPYQDYKDISYVFSIGDCGLIISKKGIGTNSVPSKTWSIMSASRPVLASFDKGSEFDRIISENSCGICVDANDKEAFKNAIFAMYNNRENLDTLGQNGRNFILKNLTKDVSTGKIISVLKGVKNG